MSVIHLPDSVRKDREGRKFRAYGSVFQKTDRIVSGEKLTVDVVTGDRVPPGLTEVGGWTDGVAISLNGDVLTEKLKNSAKPERTMAYFTGVNYHELAHCLFTPRVDDKKSLASKVASEATKKGQLFWTAFNVLEDQRAELLFVSKFRASRHYFQAIALEYLLSDPAIVQDQYPLVHGRLWIPQKTRDNLSEMYDKSVGIKGRSAEFGVIIDEYQKLVFPKDNTRGMELVKEFYALLLDSSASSGYSSGHDIVQVRQGKAAAKDQKDASESLDDAIAQLLDESKDESGDDDGDPEDEGGEKGDSPKGGASDEDGDGDDDEEGSGGKGTGDDDDDDEEPSDKGQQKGKGAGGGHNTWQDAKDVLEDVSDSLDELWENQSFVDDVADTTKSVQAEAKADAARASDVAGEHSKFSLRQAEPSDYVTIRKIQKELQELRLRLEGYWNREQPTGKVNVYDYMTRNAGDDFDVFDRWIESVEEQGGLEVVLLVDASGSMGYGPYNSGQHITKATRSAWVLKRALEEADSRVTVLSFNSSPYRVLYGPNELAHQDQYRWIAASGGTDPSAAIRESARLMDSTDKPNKLVVMLTDGQLNNPADSQLAVEWLNEQGVITAVVGLNNAVQRYGTHKAMVGLDIESASELPKFVQSLVRVMLNRLVVMR